MLRGTSGFPTDAGQWVSKVADFHPLWSVVALMVKIADYIPSGKICRILMQKLAYPKTLGLKHADIM